MVTLRQCIFIGCSDGAVGHSDNIVGQDVLDACFFDTTPVEAAVFLGGMLVLRNCLFAGAVPSWFGPGSVMTEGVQRGNTATRVVFSTASLLETCGGSPGWQARARLSPRLLRGGCKRAPLRGS